MTTHHKLAPLFPTLIFILIISVVVYCADCKTDCKVDTTSLEGGLSRFKDHIDKKIRAGEKFASGNLLSQFSQNISKPKTKSKLKSCFSLGANFDSNNMNPILTVSTMEAFDTIATILTDIEAAGLNSGVKSNVQTLSSLLKSTQHENSIKICRDYLSTIKEMNNNLYSICIILLSRSS